jgi:type I restriction enzyme S subunit
MSSEKKILHQIAMNLYRSWFIDFEPVEMKSLGLIPKNMKSAIAELFPASFEHSEDGRIPKG